MKLRVFLFLFVFLPGVAFPMDISVQYYIPSLLGVSSGRTAAVSRFEGVYSDYRSLHPVEVRFSILRYYDISMSGNAIASIYVEDGRFSSLNLSTGASIFYRYDKTASMTGLFLSVYPIYELPLIAMGKTPFFNWRMAADFGLSFLLLRRIPLKIYSRAIFVWRSGYDLLIIPDIGISLGFRFGDGRSLFPRGW